MENAYQFACFVKPNIFTLELQTMTGAATNSYFPYKLIRHNHLV